MAPNLVNPLIDGDVALLKSSLRKGNLVAAPVESGDITTAKLVTEFMQWRLGSIPKIFEDGVFDYEFSIQKNVHTFIDHHNAETIPIAGNVISIDNGIFGIALALIIE